MKLAKKVFTVAVAAALAKGGTITGAVSVTSHADSTRYEFENGTHTGSSTAVQYDDSASSGAYVFLCDAGDTASVTIDVATDGMYDIIIGAYAAYGQKTQYLEVDGVTQCDMTFYQEDGWCETTVASMTLTAGQHTVTVVSSWGWMNLDYVRIEETVIPDVYANDTWPCDEKATANTVKLMEFLSSVYGDYIISGQQEFYNTSRDDEFNYICNITGKLPVIRGFDLGNTCPCYRYSCGTVNRMIDWANDKGGIVTASWHINVPKNISDYDHSAYAQVAETGGNAGLNWDKTTYGTDTDFNTANVLIEGTAENIYFLDCVDSLAQALSKLQDNGVSVLFRPFHEAEGAGGADGSGSWFWWGKDGCDVYVQLYRYLYDLLTEEYNIHNLIWEFNSYTYKNSEYWYPGDEYVDLIGYDKYNCDGTTSNTSAISSTFYSLLSMYENTKMVAMMECDSIPTVDNMVSENAMWLYFMPWYDGDEWKDCFLSNEAYNTKENLIATYNSDYVITLDEFTTMYANFTASGTTGTRRETTERVTTTTEPIEQVIVDGAINATINKNTFTFDRAIGDTLYLIYDIDDDVDSANGCASFSLDVNGTWYWVSFQWIADGTGEQHMKIDLNNPYEVLNTTASPNYDETDPAIIQQVCEAIQQLTSGEAQIWWPLANDYGYVDGVTFVGAYILSDDADTGSSSVTTEEPKTDVGEVVSGKVSGSAGNYTFSFDRAMGDTIYLVFEADSSVSYANGCAGFSVSLGGEDYWVAYQWEISGSGTVTIDMNNPTYVQYGGNGVEVTDATLKAALIEAVQELTGGECQMWWANDSSGSEISTSNVVLTDAYLIVESASTTTVPSLDDDTSSTTTTEPVNPNEPSTGGAVDPANATIYGDVTLDGEVNMADIVQAARAVSDMLDLEDAAAANADVNLDYEVNTADVAILVQFQLGEINAIPVA